MTPKPDSMFVQKSIYDFLEDFECQRPVRWDPLISIYNKKEEENDIIGENVRAKKMTSKVLVTMMMLIKMTRKNPLGSPKIQGKKAHWRQHKVG